MEGGQAIYIGDAEVYIPFDLSPEQFPVSKHDGKMGQGLVVVVRNRNKLVEVGHVLRRL